MMLPATINSGIMPTSRSPLASWLSRYSHPDRRATGYLNRATDGPPGNTVLWRGMTRLADIALGFELATKDVGN